MEPTGTFIYTLELAEGKYYVGCSRDVERRYEEHKCGSGTEWTRLYRPIRILETKRRDKMTDEDAKVKEMMFQFGIDNVRGGTYPMSLISPIAIDFLKREMSTAKCECWRCGKVGHLSKDCALPSCSRCGRKHDAAFCMSTRHIDGTILPEVKCGRCRRLGHHEGQCNYRTDVEKKWLPAVQCKKCLRTTHTTSSCFVDAPSPVSPPGLVRSTAGETAQPVADDETFEIPPTNLASYFIRKPVCALV